MPRYTKKLEFTKRERERIKARDKGCIFCRLNYHMEERKDTYMSQQIQIMHYIPRSKQGLGIAENGACGCMWHHEMLDNGNKGRREEMLELFRNYLRAHYDDWNEEDLIYKKYDF